MRSALYSRPVSTGRGHVGGGLRSSSAVGDTQLAQWFYAGRYADVIAATFDSDHEVAAVDVAFVVGALSFVDRVDDGAPASMYGTQRPPRVRAVRTPEPSRHLGSFSAWRVRAPATSIARSCCSFTKGCVRDTIRIRGCVHSCFKASRVSA